MKLPKLKYQLLFILGMIFFLVPLYVSAQVDASQVTDIDKQLNVGAQSAGLSTTTTTATDPRILIASILSIVLKLLGTLFVGLILTGGYRLIKADGDSTKIEEAKETIQKAAVGLLIILMAYSISTFVGNKIVGSINNAAPQTGYSSGQK